MDTTKTITHVGLCAGYGGIELGLGRVIKTLRSVALCEIEAFAIANLVSKMEAGQLEPVPVWTDLKTFPWGSFRDRVDILTGGYPCQPFSAAGKRLGKDDPRHLWPWIADGIRTMRPRVCFFENVEGHISLGLREVISELESIGYKTTWGIFSAREVGAPHQRKRVFILAYLCSEGLQGREWIGQSGRADATAWPSRPGEPQHEWEPPRVVGNTILHGHAASEISGSTCQSEAEGWMQESKGGSASVGDTEHDGLHGATPGRCYEADARSWSEEESEVEQQRQRAGGMGSEIRTVMGNSADERSPERRSREVSESRSKQKTKRSDASPECQTQPSLGGDSDGSTNRMDDAELFVACDNRTDELRLLGNGVVPATAERAFITLMDQLITQ